MEDEKLHKGIQQIKKITMTDAEKERMLGRILSTSQVVKKPVQSSWVSYSFIFSKRHRFFYASIAMLLIVFVGGREAVFASEESLPGDALYAVKVNIVEPVRARLTFSQEAKAEYESTRAKKRMVEAETLASTGNLDETKQKEIAVLLETHTKALEKSLIELDKEKSSDKIDDIVRNFQAGMNAHAKVLDIIDSDQKEEDTPEGNEISKTARASVDTIRTNWKTKEINSSERYNKKKEMVKSLIDSTNKNLDRTESKDSRVQQRVINTAQETLDQAAQLLKESDEGNIEENKENAYSKLLESENSVTEADIFLKAGLQLKEENTHSKRDRNSIKEQSFPDENRHEWR